MIQVSIHSTGSGRCALSGKDESEGLTVAFNGEEPTFLSFKAFKQLLSMKTAQLKPEPKRPTVAAPAPPVAAVAAGAK